MKDKESIKKWLDGSLTPEERADFEQTDDYAFVRKLTDGLRKFKAPDFPVEEELSRYHEKYPKQAQPKTRFLGPLLKIAAVILLVSGLSYWFVVEKPFASDLTTISATNQQELFLPDSSFVVLNKHSSIAYDKTVWSEDRDVQLVGEAYFQVEPGERFDVLTDAGKVSVLGTRFNVKYRPGYFEVTCYEGKVAVETENNDRQTLLAGDQYRIVHGKSGQRKFADQNSPSWTKNVSTFTSVPIIEVLREFERQYEVTIQLNMLDTSRLFTGSFTHKDPEVALKSITIPLGLKYRFSQGKIILTE